MSSVADPPGPTDRHPNAVRRMFAGIAARYDRANRILSLGRDLAWRRVVAREMAPGPGQTALDLACGTGDLARALAAAGPGGRVVGVDFTRAMLARAVRRPGPSVAWVGGDALRLPFRDDTFDGVTVAFGVRNFTDLQAGLAEIGRVLRPDGRLAILEFSRPVGLLAPGATLWLRRIVPGLGGLIAGDRAAYDYLARTISTWPDQEGLARILRDAGYVRVRWRNFTAGVAALHTASWAG